MKTRDGSQVLWTKDQETEIENACEHALMSLDTWGAMHLKTLIKALEKQGYKQRITNANGDTGNLASIVFARLCLTRRIKTMHGRTILLTRDAEVDEEDSVAVKHVLKTLKELGGVATHENLESFLSLDGYGKKTIEDAVAKLRKSRRAKYAFPLSPNSRVWIPRK